MKMRKPDLVCRSLLAALLLPLLLEAAQKKTAPAKPAPKSPAQAASSNQAKSPPSTHKTAKKTVSRKRRPRSAPVARGQAQPTRERYAEIQTALAKAGYFHEPSDGKWGKSSVDALTEFQRDNGLEPTGRIDAMSLIKLELGPKYGETAEARNTTPSLPQ